MPATVPADDPAVVAGGAGVDVALESQSVDAGGVDDQAASPAVTLSGGSSVTILSDELGRRISAFDRRLDWLVIANTQEDQVAALPRAMP